MEPEFSLMEQLRHQLIEICLPRPLAPAVSNTAFWKYLPTYPYTQDFFRTFSDKNQNLIFWIYRNLTVLVCWFWKLGWISGHKIPVNWGLYIQKRILTKVFGEWGLTRLQTNYSTFIIWFVVNLESVFAQFWLLGKYRFSVKIYFD